MIGLKNKIRKLGAGFIAGICAFSMLGTNLSIKISASAANTISTENSAFPTVDKVIAQAATLLGSPYGWGFKGYTGVYYQGSYTPLSLDFVQNQGVDCSGLIYYTMTHLGYKTSGFSWNNPVPVDTMHWLTVSDKCTVTYNGVTSKIDVEKKAIKSTERPYWECADGSTITPGSVVIADNLNGEDHSWIYMGEFDSRNDVVDYLRSIGISDNLITSKTVGDGKGDGGKHWRIESNGSQGVVINNNTDGKKSTAMNMYAFRIAQADVKFTITKVLSTDNSVKISGTSPIDGTKAIYGVYTDKSCKNKVGEITIGADGTGSVMLPNKQYFVREISAPTGYDLSQDVVELKVNSNVTVQEDITSGKIIVNKTAEDGIVSNREFKISWTENGIEHSKNAITNDNGIAEFDNLHVYDLGSKSEILYNIAEINTEERYEIPKAQDVTLTGGNADLTVSADFENTLKKGSIKINKQSEDGENGDRRFTVSGGGQTYTLTTNSEGTAIFADIPVFDSRDNPIVYTVSENDVPVKYVVPAEQTITLEADETVEITFENKLKKFTAEVTKKDSENGKVQGDASLTGAVYGIYCGDELIDEYVTDENGYFKTKEYACGDYTLQEISPSEGYLLDENVYTLGTEPKNYTVEINPISIEVMEDIKKGNISIIKHSDANENVVENLEMGAEFEVFLKSAGSYDNAKDYEKDYLTTDENGFAQSKNLPYGVYTVRQTKTVNDAEFVSDFDVFIAENGKTYEFILNDAPFKSYIHITKIDSETGKIIPYEGAGFQIFDSENQLVNMGVDTFYTNSEGFLITPETLPYGDYTLVEVQAPIGYVLDKTPVAFSVTAANAEEENAVNIVRVIKSNTAQKGRISVQKKGVIFSSVNENEENYTPIFAEKGLENAVFHVIAAEDIITPDGTVRANAGDVVSELVTDENGYAETDLLYLGKYEITEACSPYGYVKNPEIQMVDLAYAGQEIEVRDTVNQTFVNDYQEIEITLSKFMEYDELFEIGNNDEYRFVRFGLFAAEDIIAADGSAIPENGMIAEVSLGEDMTAKFDVQLPFARYYVQEIATDEHYVLNNEKYLVNFEYMGQEMTTVYVDCGQFDNLLKRGKVNGVKVNEAGEHLENAMFGLFNTDCKEFTADNSIMTARSNKEGKFEFTEIPYGEYVVKEIFAPDGYILSDEKFPVIVSEDGEIIEITAGNKPITVEISKQDIYGNEIIGAEMELINSDGEVVEKWISDGKNHVITCLYAGEYVLKETAAPDGYVIATDIEFEVFVDGSVMLKNIETTAVSEDGNPLIVMVDEVVNIPEIPDISWNPTPSYPKTGNIGRSTAGLVMIFTGFVVLIFSSVIRRKRKGKETDIECKYAELCPDFIERKEKND